MVEANIDEVCGIAEGEAVLRTEEDTKTTSWARGW